uniref:SLC26A/SulP transporter domain-containing protein n=1 Tax=Kalanchoe fedtschenkoi TaxID=63787 RepID=A0A7N0T7G8_KALFE
MSNVMQAICIMLTLLFLAPIFSYTPLVALSAIITSAIIGLLEYEEVFHQFTFTKLIRATSYLSSRILWCGLHHQYDYGLLMSVSMNKTRLWTCCFGSFQINTYPFTIQITSVISPLSS